jgi:hypothetical protein
MNRLYGVRPESNVVQGCHAPHVVHGGVKRVASAFIADEIARPQ